MQLAILELALVPIVLFIIFPVENLSTIAVELVVPELTVVKEVLVLESAKSFFDSVFHLAGVNVVVISVVDDPLKGSLDVELRHGQWVLAELFVHIFAVGALREARSV